MQGIGPAPRNFAMNALGLPLVATALDRGELLRVASCPAAGNQAFPITGHRNVLQPQVDPDGFLRRDALLGLSLDRQAQPPVPERILGKAAALPFDPFQAFTLEHPKALAGKAQADAPTLKTCRFEGYPAERAPGPTTHPPAQLQPTRGLAFLGVVHTNRLNRIGADLVKIRGCTGSQAA